jgi:hypothetical protein
VAFSVPVYEDLLGRRIVDWRATKRTFFQTTQFALTPLWCMHVFVRSSHDRLRVIRRTVATLA